MKARTILCYPMPERGHFYPFFHVAKQLQSRGHRLVFLGPADLRDHAVAEGFDFLCVLEDLLPQGYLEKREAVLSGTSGISRLRHLMRYQREITQVFEQTILRGATDAAIEKLSPDLILAEAFAPVGALVAHRLGIRAMKDRLVREQSTDVGADAIEMVLEQPDLLRTPGALKARVAGKRVH